MAKRVFKILSGLSSFQVVARDANDVGCVNVTGRSTHFGAIRARVLSGKDVKLNWRNITEATDGDVPWTGTIGDLPVGGPYTVELQVVSALGAELAGLQIKHVLVGDLWVLAGQSNMHGVGDLDSRIEKPDKKVSCFAMREVWETATEPLHAVIESPDPCHWSCTSEERPRLITEARRNQTKGAGLGISFAKALVRHTGVPIGLIPCAHGGTSMLQWSPSRKHEGGRSFYGSLLRRVAAAGGRVKGILWYQGEAECGSEGAPLFTQRFTELVRSFREDLSAPELPFFYVQVARFPHAVANAACWDQVREAQRRCEQSIPGTVMVSAVDLPLDDAIHISTDGQKRLGKRLADAACRVVYGAKEITAGPRLKTACFVDAQRTRLKLTYENVNGKLLSTRRVGGFSACDAAGKPIFLVFDSFVDPGNACVVILKLEPTAPLGTMLYYGGGADSLCTLVDERDHAAPAFGPMQLDDVPVEKQ